ncbi:Mrp/NBP35 family ATP-binding protein [Reichenbachiella versicolor]|uniref:Mrp/NBP35 family ATP-binding protein n=1 Tax=Reichenbachiella versicolor TaxID=1821036 RepID=UPI000D6E7E32|nr:Mrp/NBP35 family ATP-binding protein [Reichenbachiella versicolor]
MVTEKDLLKALSTVEDPDLKKDLVTLNMIKDIQIDDSKISFSVELTTPACPLKEKIKNDCIKAVEKIASGEEISINMTADVTSTRQQSFTLPGVKNIIAVSSGKGGVGKSTVTSNLAVALAKSGANVGIIDADIFGPSIPTMFNCEYEQPEMIKEGDKNLIVPIQKYGVKLASIGFLVPKDNAVIWRGPMASSALKQFVSDVQWGELDYLLIDLPPGTSDIHLTLVQSVPVTGAIIVTSPQKVAIADAQKGLSMFKLPQINVPILGVIENMAYFTPEELPENKYYIFGQDGGKNLAEKENVNFLGEIPIVQSIRESGDSGFPAVMKDGITENAFTELAQTVARKVAIRNATQEKSKVVEIN